MWYRFSSIVLTFVVASALSGSLYAAETAAAGRELAKPRAAARYVTIDMIRQSLPATPVTAGFDIDDTVIFSSPGFAFGANNTDGVGGKSRYGDNFLLSPQFWRDLNQYHDRYSMKKMSGDRLLQMHKGRGDTIVFITKRICFDDDAEVLAKRLNLMFSVQAKVFCTDEQSKTAQMSDNRVDVYYGDSDSDIIYATEVKSRQVRPIRVMRSPLSTNSREKGYNPGTLGEEVLVDSEN